MNKLTCCSIVLCLTVFLHGYPAQADDTASLATGGYALGVRTKEMMVKVDTDGDGMVSREEWTTFQATIFSLLDKAHKGSVDAAQFTRSGSAEIADFATGGFARGLQTVEMMRKIDVNGDGRVTREEFMAYQQRIFDMMDTSASHQGFLGQAEIFASGGPGLNK
jgi:hypothetical protein